ncbi:hypothetical protein ALC60_14555, partial [Trachymyrmex zeteki]
KRELHFETLGVAKSITSEYRKKQRHVRESRDKTSREEHPVPQLHISDLTSLVIYAPSKGQNFRFFALTNSSTLRKYTRKVLEWNLKYFCSYATYKYVSNSTVLSHFYFVTLYKEFSKKDLLTKCLDGHIFNEDYSDILRIIQLLEINIGQHYKIFPDNYKQRGRKNEYFNHHDTEYSKKFAVDSKKGLVEKIGETAKMSEIVEMSKFKTRPPAHVLGKQCDEVAVYQYDTHYHMAMTPVVNCVEQFNENLKEHPRHSAARLPDEPVAPSN